MPDGATLEERWRSVVLAVRAEFWNDRRDPNETFTSLFPLRLLRGAVPRGTGPPDWFERTIDDTELDELDPQHIAREFFEGYRRALGARQPPGGA